MDNLELGKIITREQQRDAIHIAVVPVIAREQLEPGEHVGIAQRDGQNIWIAKYTFKNVGVVDPFLTSAVLPGQHCWLFLYPGSITSLRHDWTHPDLPADG